MYLSLCKLLRFDKAKNPLQKRKDRVLICRRDFTFLGNVTRKLNGHTTLLKCYEAALGELHFTGYIPEFSAHVSVLVDETSRRAMYRNADASELTGERQFIDSEDARPLLPYYLDRLRLAPSKPMVLAKGIDLHDGFRKNQGLQSAVRAQGFALKARVHGGVGRILTRKVLPFLGVLHVLEVRTSTPKQVLDLRLYEPRRQRTMTLRLTRFQRKVLLGAVNDDTRYWLPLLLKRMSVDWRGRHSIRLDRSLYRAIRNIGGERIMVTLSVEDEESLRVDLLHPLTSLRFRCRLSKEDLIKLLLYEPPAEMVHRRSHRPPSQHGDGAEGLVAGAGGGSAAASGAAMAARKKKNQAISAILQEMRREFSLPESAISPQTHPAVFEKPMEFFLTDRLKMVHLADQLALVLELTAGDSMAKGFSSRGQPVSLFVKPVVVDEALAPPPEKVKTKLVGVCADARAGAGAAVNGEGGQVSDGAEATEGAGTGSVKDTTDPPAESAAEAADEEDTKTERADADAEAAATQEVPETEEKKAPLEEKQEEEEEKEPVSEVETATEFRVAPGAEFDTSLRVEQLHTPPPHTGDYASCIRSRRQQAVICMEEQLDLLAQDKARQADERARADAQAALAVEAHLAGLGGASDAARASGYVPVDGPVQRAAIKDATQSAAEDVLGAIHGNLVERFRERDQPGQHQKQFEAQRAAEETEAARLEEERKANAPPWNPEDSAIVGMDWTPVFEAGCKSHYREGKVRWQGHISVKVFETTAWLGGGEGPGRRFKFDVFEPQTARHYEGFIRSRKHLREVLGVHGQDLLDPAKTKEMLMFVCKTRLDVVVNKKTWDGVDVEPGAPPYRIEFQSDRLYSEDKVTPVNANTEEDDLANERKLIDIENARGKKIVRLVRRISGLLMQLTVFELPGPVAEAAYATTKAQLMAAAAQHAAAAAAAADNEFADDDDDAALPPLRRQELKRIDSRLLEIESTPDGADQGQNEGEGAAAATAGGASGIAAEVEAGAGAGGAEAGAEAGAAGVDGTEDGMNRTSGFAEERMHTTILTRHPPTAFRIVGYDPRSKRKTTLGVEPQAIIEVAGGVFSPYLAVERRRELAKVVCDSLVLVFPANSPFELLVPWSGAKKDVSSAVASTTASGKMSERSGAERVLKRSGKLFRSALRISKYELVVSLYSHVVSQVAGGMDDNPDNFKLIFNFYSPAVSEAAEVVLTITDQVDRIGKPVLKFTEGAIRAAAIRRLCRFFSAEIIEDILDSNKKTLHVALLPPKKGFVTDYQDVFVPPPGESIRPVGLPTVFFPLDTCGYPLHRRGMSLPSRDRRMPEKEFLVTVYTKSQSEHAERGLVVKLYDRSVSSTSILHVGASELMRICDHADEPDLLKDLVQAQLEEDQLSLDEIERGFSDFTEKGALERRTQTLKSRLMDIVLDDLGFFVNPQDQITPYIRSAPRGILPS